MSTCGPWPLSFSRYFSLSSQAGSQIQVFNYQAGTLHSTIDSQGSKLRRPTGWLWLDRKTSNIVPPRYLCGRQIRLHRGHWGGLCEEVPIQIVSQGRVRWEQCQAVTTSETPQSDQQYFQPEFSSKVLPECQVLNEFRLPAIILVKKFHALSKFFQTILNSVIYISVSPDQCIKHIIQG